MLIGGLGLGLSLYSAKAMTFDRVLESAQAQAAAAPNAPILVNVFLPGGCDLLSTLHAAVAGRAAQRPAQDARPDRHAARRLQRPRAAREPVRRRQRRRARDVRGRQDRLPARHRLRRTPTCRTSTRATSGRRGIVSPLAGPGWLGRWLDVAGSADNPLQGLTLGGDAVADAADVGRAGRLAEQPARRAAELRRHLGRRRGHHRAGVGPPGRRRVEVASRARRRRDVRAARPQRGHEARALRGAEGRRRPARPADRLPRGQRFGDKLSRAAALLAQPLGIRVATVEARRRLRHPRRPAHGARAALRALSQALSAFQADLEMRGIAAARPHLRVVGVRPPPAVQRVRGHRPRRRRASPGCRALRAKPRDPHRLPRPVAPGRARQPRRDRRLPPRLRLAAGGVAGHDPADAVLPGAASFGRVALVA